MSSEEAYTVAVAVSDVMGWDDDQIAREVDAYRQYLNEHHLFPRNSAANRDSSFYDKVAVI